MGGGAIGDGVIVDLTSMGKGMIEVDAGRRVARTSGSVTVTQLNQAAGHHGLRMPVEPSSAEVCDPRRHGRLQRSRRPDGQAWRSPPLGSGASS